MSVIASDVIWRYTTGTSIGTGNGGNAGGAASTATTSLGKYCSQTAITSGSLNSIFADISAANNNNSTWYYKAVCLHNSNATSALNTITVTLSRASTTSGAGDIFFLADGSPIGYSTTTTFNSTAAVTTAPGGPGTPPTGGSGGGTWTSVASNSSQSLSTFSLTAGQFQPIWIAIQGNNTAASSETITLSWSGTAP